MVREKFPSETAESVSALAELFLDHNLGKSTNNFVRSECCYHLWRHSCAGSTTRAEIVKLGCLYKLVETVDKGDTSSCFHALGCLVQFVESEDFKSLILSHTGVKLIRCLGDCLNKRSHPRTQVQSSRILIAIASNPETAGRLVPIVPKLVEALHISGPSWSKVYEICAQVANCLRILAYAESSGDPQYTLTGSSKKIRKDMVKRGAVQNCVELLKCNVEEVKVAVLATLHSLLTEPTCIDELRLLDSAVASLSQALASPSIDAKAHSAGCLLALSQNKEHAREIGETRGAIKELVQMLSTQQPRGKSKKKKKSKEKESLGVSGPALCLENAAGLLLQLTVCEENTEEMVKENSIPILVAFLKSKSLVVNQASTCILASMGLNDKYHPLLIEAQAPEYLYRKQADAD